VGRISQSCGAGGPMNAQPEGGLQTKIGEISTDDHSSRIRALQAMLDYILAEGAELKLAHFVILMRAASIVLDRELD